MEKKFPFQNTSLPLEKRLADLMGRLTLEEKISLVPTRQAAIPRLGIKQYDIGAEGAHGFVNREGPCTTFTQTQGLSCTWDRGLLRKAGKVTGEEARVFYNRTQKNGLSLWAPTIDMERDPRWGRTEEGYGEDPYLTGELAGEFIAGIQNDDGRYITASCAPKHFFGNNNEKFRATCNCSIDPRNMHEYYLEPFRRVYRKSAPYSLMCAYNKVNGVSMMLNPAIRDIVKKEWGLGERGQVVTDGGAITNLIKELNKTPGESVQISFEHGADNMNDEISVVEAAIKEALNNNLITEKELDKHVAASLRVRFKFGHFDCGGCPMDKWGKEHYMTKDSEKLARQAVAESVVLLKNESPAIGAAPLLPLNPKANKKIFVTGPLADCEFPDWYTGMLPYLVTPLEGLKKRYGAQNVTYVDSRDVYSFTTAEGKPLVLNKEGRLLPAKTGKPSCFYCDDWGWGANTLYSKQFNAYLDMVVDPSKIDPEDPEKSKREATDFLFQASAKTTWAWYISTLYNFIDADSNLLSVKQTLGKARASFSKPVYIRAWNSKTLSLNKEKSSIKLDMAQNDTPTTFNLTVEEEGITKAAIAAAKADVAIVIVGNNSLVNGKEEMDRPDIVLPPYQKRLVRAVHEANPNTVLVMVSGYPYAIPEENREIPSIIYMAHGMQESGNGLADVLSGEVSPAGRLNMTWYNSAKDLPPMQNYDIITRQRTYQYYEKPVLYPFGYGLSYTSFAYTNLKVTKGAKSCTVLDEKPATVSCTVTNTGAVASDEVVQLYLVFHGGRVVRPLKTLRGFERIHLLPGTSSQVDFRLTSEDTRIWDVTRSRWCIEQGTVTVAVGPSSSDFRLTTDLPVEGEIIPPRNMTHITVARDYDSCKNVFLYDRPGRDLCAVYSGAAVFDTDRNTNLDSILNQNEDAELKYKTGNFFKGVSRFIATVATEGACSLEICTETAIVAHADLPVTGDNCAVPGSHPRPLWSTVTIPLSGLAGIQDIRLVLHGRMAIQMFRFE